MRGNFGIFNLILLVFFVALVYLMMIRPQKKKDKAMRDMRAGLSVGDEIITIGGIIGKITKISDDTVVISTGTGSNKVEFLKTAISGIRKKGDNIQAKKEVKESVSETKKKSTKKVTPKKLGNSKSNAKGDKKQTPKKSTTKAKSEEK